MPGYGLSAKADAGDMIFSLTVLLAFIGGLLLGLFYFGSLRMTVAYLAQSRKPLLVLFTSFIVRIALLLIGLYFIMWHNWLRGLAALVGIFLMRTILIVATGVPQGANLPGCKPRDGD